MNRVVLLIIIFFLSETTLAQNLESGLIGHWKLDNNAIDQSINSNHGMIVNAESAINRFGHPNSALYFKDNGYVHFGNVLNLGLKDFSISGWFNLDENAYIKGEMSMISKIDMPSENKYAAGIFNSRFAIVFGNKILYCRDDQFVLEKGVWYHFTATFDRDNLLSIYLNGEVICQEDITIWENVNLSEGGDLRIGEYSGHRRHFYGILDEFRMYDRILSSVEVSLLYNEEENINCSLLNENQSGQIEVGDGEGFSDNLLSVAGTVLSDSIRIAQVTNWPDYVFSETYDLLDLEDVASYIKEQGHLPGLPSAEEVLSDGISLKHMDKTNLKKIEELSLYLLDQHA
ncbi:LamG domain-containing protein, partial [Salegentibacter salinarum]